MLFCSPTVRDFKNKYLKSFYSPTVMCVCVNKKIITFFIQKDLKQSLVREWIMSTSWQLIALAQSQISISLQWKMFLSNLWSKQQKDNRDLGQRLVSYFSAIISPLPYLHFHPINWHSPSQTLHPLASTQKNTNNTLKLSPGRLKVGVWITFLSHTNFFDVWIKLNKNDFIHTKV